MTRSDTDVRAARPGRVSRAVPRGRGAAAPAKPAAPAPSRPVGPAKPAQGRSAAPVKPAAPAKAAPSRSAPSRSAARPPAARTARPSRQGRPPRAPFVLLVVGLLCGGLVSLLLLNVVLAQDSYRLNELRDGISELQQQKADRENENARLDTPEELAKRAELQGQNRDWDSMNTIDSRVASQGQAPVTRERVEGTGR
ncbi:hypothetical protein [Streptosporangium pseudovulgare]|uniref:Cell division protein FtsL n=1 Tax=Streptosporangium pseudovulgare TaxID=35765 RepID=A0ABQ2QED5_9ACTN|nr:hypothetical protein [Streptosporangium pseudovulgare]GGP77185.1 hypothetical protein GCM10010140_01340 [Streptosporangium pseudovulgare]